MEHNDPDAQRRVKILVTDDDPDIQKITKLNLLREGFDVLQAFSGVECMEVLKSERPDLILLDLMMPEMDGFETVKRIKSMEITQNIPVVMVTAREQIADKLKCFSFKADDYVVKPYDFEELLTRIYLHLNQSLTRREGERRVRSRFVREVMEGLSTEVGAAYVELQAVLKSDPGNHAIAEAAEAMMRVVETTHERENPMYESPFVELEEIEVYDDDSELLKDVIDTSYDPGT